MQRQSIRAAVLSLVLVVSVFAGVGLGPATAAAQTDGGSDSTTTNWNATGETYSPISDTWPQGFAEHNGSLYVGAGQNSNIHVLDETLSETNSYNLSSQPTGLARYNGNWLVASGTDNVIYEYSDDFATREIVLDNSSFAETEFDSSPWNIDTSDGRLYVADKGHVTVFNESFEQVNRINVSLSNTYALQVESGSIFAAGDDDEYVYETDLEGNLLQSWDIQSDLGGENPNGFGLYNGNWYVGTAGNSEALYEFEADIDRTVTVSGRVSDQRDTGVANATVVATGVIEDQLEATDPSELEAEADALLSDLSDPLPSEWNPDYDLEAHADDASAEYALVHESRDWSVGTTTIVDSSIDDPRLTVSPEREVVLSLWDPESGGGVVSDQVDNSYPGGTTSGELVVEQLAGSGDTLETQTYETEVIAETTGANPLSTNDHHGVRTHLPVGVYRVAPASNPAGGYVVTVGSPEEIAQSITDDARDEAGRLTDRADRVRSLLASETIVRETTRTDSEGRFSLSVDERVVSVRVSAMKADGSVLEGVENASLEDLRKARLEGYNGSVYLPSPTAESVAVPADGVSVDVYRSPRIPNGDIESFADLQRALEGELLNESTAELDRWSERLEEIDADRRAALRDELSGVLENASSDADLSELQRDLAELEQRLETGPVDVTPGDGTVSAAFPIADVSGSDVTVLAHTADGETRAVPSEYWRVESGGLLGTDSVVVSEYPLGESDPASVTFEVVADGAVSGTVRETVSNPAVGDLPAIDALDVSTLSPGPDERVSLEVDPSADSRYSGLAGIDVYAPDGERVNASVSDGDATFTTAGEGVHHVRLTVRDQSGAEYVVSERIRAEPVARSDPPTIRAGSGATGEYAVVSGLESARIESAGSDVAVTAVVAGDETPAEIHVMPDGVLEGASTDLSVQVVRGSDETAVDTHMGVVIHTESGLSDSGLLWRNGDAMPVDGSSRFGEVLDRGESGDKKVIRTYTDADGQVTVGISNDAGPLERLQHWISHAVPSPEVPYWITGMVAVPLVSRRVVSG